MMKSTNTVNKSIMSRLPTPSSKRDHFRFFVVYLLKNLVTLWSEIFFRSVVPILNFVHLLICRGLKVILTITQILKNGLHRMLVRLVNCPEFSGPDQLNGGTIWMGGQLNYWVSNTEIPSGFCLLQRQELRKIVGAAAQNEESSCPLTLHCTGDRSPADASLEILTSVLLPYATWGETSETSSCFSGHSHPSSGSYPTLPRKMLTPKIRNSPFCNCCFLLWPNY